LIESTAYVLYFPDDRMFLSGSARTFSRTEKFEKARLFPQAGHAKSSAKRHVGSVLIPVQLTLDPKNMFIAILQGDSNERE